MGDFDSKNNVHFPFKQLFGWQCPADCDYKCQQIITDIRISQGAPIVKFYGKWPFKRVFGMTEVASVVFSLLNFLINYHNFRKINPQRKRSSGPVRTMYGQYLVLLSISMVGWTFSMLFHTRDLPITETLDYFGASLIILFNFYIIIIRYFELFKNNLLPFQIAIGTIYGLHLVKLSHDWDYNYNLVFHSVIGIITLVLWVLHSVKVSRIYTNNYPILSNSIQLLPFETKILMKLNYLSLSKSKYIPLLPILLNLWMFGSMFFEICEFKPILKVVDSHAMWHLATFFPQIIWYDWNMWDLELYKRVTELSI
ncbi:hypothetical protein PSN45_000652 [Yamadazyma tenuis]|nr:Per1-like protein [Yamadazyma tenuis ATCC 10573]EGV62714.1 Per1-like protein [Yamadazyma tenuis ATCC 10573]WEJ93191.1 hypothetical protein PSN45_000652 [Yamadazyma tenuis]